MPIITNTTEAMIFACEHLHSLTAHTAILRLNHEMDVAMTIQHGTVTMSLCDNTKTITCNGWLSARRTIIHLFREFWFMPGNIQNRWSSFITKEA